MKTIIFYVPNSNLHNLGKIVVKKIIKETAKCLYFENFHGETKRIKRTSILEITLPLTNEEIESRWEFWKMQINRTDLFHK